MSAKIALKKLKKQTKKIEKNSLKQLHKLVNTTDQRVLRHSELHNEIKDLSQDVIVSMMSELKTPLEPVISWFKEGLDSVEQSREIVAKRQISPRDKRQRRTVNHTIMNIPLKSPACKTCPALKNGSCKCAMKKFKNS